MSLWDRIYFLQVLNYIQKHSHFLFPFTTITDFMIRKWKKLSGEKKLRFDIIMAWNLCKEMVIRYRICIGNKLKEKKSFFFPHKQHEIASPFPNYQIKIGYVIWFYFDNVGTKSISYLTNLNQHFLSTLWLWAKNSAQMFVNMPTVIRMNVDHWTVSFLIWIVSFVRFWCIDKNDYFIVKSLDTRLVHLTTSLRTEPNRLNKWHSIWKKRR